MPTLFNPFITDAGLAAAIASSGSGLQLAITHVALGAGQYDSGAVSAGQTSLVAFREAATIASGLVGVGGSFTVTVRFAPWSGFPAVYNANEIGFYAGDPTAGGVLFAVYSFPSVLIQQRNSASDFLATFTLQLARIPAGSVTVTVDPSASAGVGLMAAHEAKPDPHPQYIKEFGTGVALPSVDIGTIWRADYASLMTWQVFSANGASYSGYASVYVGRIELDAQPTARVGKVKTGAANLSKTARAALWNWALHNDIVVPLGSWTQGMNAYADNGDGTFRVADLRAETLRVYDDGRGVDIARVFTAWQAGQFPSHTHTYQAELEPTSMYISTEPGYKGRNVGNTGSTGGTENASENRMRNFAQLGSIQT